MFKNNIYKKYSVLLLAFSGVLICLTYLFSSWIINLFEGEMAKFICYLLLLITGILIAVFIFPYPIWDYFIIKRKQYLTFLYFGILLPTLPLFLNVLLLIFFGNGQLDFVSFNGFKSIVLTQFYLSFYEEMIFRILIFLGLLQLTASFGVSAFFGATFFSLIHYQSYSDNLVLLESVSIFGAAILLSCFLIYMKSFWLCVLYHFIHNILNESMNPIYHSQNFSIDTLKSLDLVFNILIQTFIIVFFFTRQKPSEVFRSPYVRDLS